ncbi:MAG: hypothetical protein ABII00_14865 [Elusimicrobiota bacterium]
MTPPLLFPARRPRQPRFHAGAALLWPWLAEDPLARLGARAGWLFWLKALFFLSGSTALAYEVLWTRLFSNIVGSTAAAMTCVFTVFIASLALGALLAARLRLQGRGALALYGALEVLVGLLGLGLTVLLLRRGDWIASFLGAGQGPGRLAASLGAAMLLLGPPTILMGMTLPLVLGAVKGRYPPRNQVHLLYGLNTLGGALGALACGFFLIWRLGVTGTACLAAGADVAIGLAALLLSLRLRTAPARRPAEPSPSLAGSLAAEPLLPALAFLCGLASLSYELLWGRLAKLYLGDRTLATAALLFVYLSCMALGSFLARAPRRREPARAANRLAVLFAAAAVLHVLGLRLAAHVIDGSLLASWLSSGRETWARVAATFLAAGPGATALGVCFPYMLRACPETDRTPGRAVGLLYGVNTLGAALGAVLGGIILPRSVGTVAGFLLTSALLLAAAAACWLRFLPKTRRAVAASAAAACLALAWGLRPPGLFFPAADEALLAAHEDEYGIQVVTRDVRGNLKVKNNRTGIANKLGEYATSYAQESIAYFSCLLSRDCRAVLNIGTGYGITAGAFTRFAGIESIRTVEILPFLLESRTLFKAYNFSYFDDPRVELVHGDGRHLLAAEARTYDVISVNVLDPYLPGSSSLYTVDFWRLAKRRLNPGGVYSQLLWGPDLPLLLRGLRSVFPTVLYFPAYGNSYNVVALAEPAGEPPVRWERLAGPVAQALRRLGAHDPRPFVEAAVGYGRTLPERFDTADAAPASGDPRRGRAPAAPADGLHTDDRPVLEYRWSHGEGRISIFDSLQLTE